MSTRKPSKRLNDSVFQSTSSEEDVVSIRSISEDAIIRVFQSTSSEEDVVSIPPYWHGHV